MATNAQQVSATLVELADTLVSDYDVFDYLDRLLEHSTTALGAAAGGVMLTSKVGRVVAVLVAVSAVGGAVDFWTFPTGNYAETFESRGESFPWQFLASVVAGLLLIVLAVIRRRGGQLEWALLALLGVGMLLGSVWTPAPLWPAFAWASFAMWLGWVGTGQSTPSTWAG